MKDLLIPSSLGHVVVLMAGLAILLGLSFPTGPKVRWGVLVANSMLALGVCLMFVGTMLLPP